MVDNWDLCLKILTFLTLGDKTQCMLTVIGTNTC